MPNVNLLGDNLRASVAADVPWNAPLHEELG